MIPNNVRQNVPLAPLTTLKIGGEAKYFADISEVSALREVVHWARENDRRVTVLGGGSNVLMREGLLEGVVIHINIGGITYQEHGNETVVTVGAGVVLDELVRELVERGVWGLENLSAIPGSVGATPIQNVGAYGVEVSDRITSVTVYDMENDQFLVLHSDACKFGYRDSVFKHEMAGKYIVVSVTFLLTKTPTPVLSYNDVTRYFKDNPKPTLRDIREAIIAIRSKKFPDWRIVGTAGSFFKNPVLTEAAFKALRGKHPTVPGFTLPDGRIKVPLGFVLDKILNLKGERTGDVGLYEDQALVLVNYGGASYTEVETFAKDIVERVKVATGIDVEYEVTYIH